MELVAQVAVWTPSMSLGYYGDPAKESEAFIEVTEDKQCPEGIVPALPPIVLAEKDGRKIYGRWYLTGDLGMLDNTNKLTLIDRVS